MIARRETRQEIQIKEQKLITNIKKKKSQTRTMFRAKYLESEYDNITITNLIVIITKKKSFFLMSCTKKKQNMYSENPLYATI